MNTDGKLSNRFGIWLIVTLLTGFALTIALATIALSTQGAAYTTFNTSQGGCLDSPNGVNCNHYQLATDVYMNGGPLKASLSPGCYYFSVLVPGYQNGGFIQGAKGNLSDTTAGGTTFDAGSGDAIANRTFRVTNSGVVYNTGSVGGCVINATHAKGVSPIGKDPIVQLWPFDRTSNPGGVYILAICPVGATDPKDCKYDAFKVEEFVPPAVSLTINKTLNGGAVPSGFQFTFNAYETPLTGANYPLFGLLDTVNVPPSTNVMSVPQGSLITICDMGFTTATPGVGDFNSSLLTVSWLSVNGATWNGTSYLASSKGVAPPESSCIDIETDNRNITIDVDNSYLVGKRITGGGRVAETDADITGPPAMTQGYELHCDPRVEPNNLQVNWGKGNRFHLSGNFGTALCYQDPNITGPAPPEAAFNTYIGEGCGFWNGKIPAKAVWKFTDEGEPGGGRNAVGPDKVNMLITANHSDCQGSTGTPAVILDVTGYLKGGNNQAH